MVNKITSPITPLEEISKINEIIDELGNIDPLPSQTGQSGKYLTTDGTNASWGTVNTGANTDLSNLTDNGNIAMAGASMPSTRFIDLTINASGSSYTAPADGWFNFRGYGYSVEIYRNDMHVCCMYPQTEWGAVIMPVQKGQTITVLYNLTGDRNLRFYYAKGSESEA